MQNKLQNKDDTYRIEEFSMGNNRLSFSLLGSHIDIEFTGKEDKRIELGRGYNLHFVLDWNYEQFLNASVLENVKDVENASLQPPLKIKKQGRPRTGKTKKTA